MMAFRDETMTAEQAEITKRHILAEHKRKSELVDQKKREAYAASEDLNEFEIEHAEVIYDWAFEPDEKRGGIAFDGMAGWNFHDLARVGLHVATKRGLSVRLAFNGLEIIMHPNEEVDVVLTRYAEAVAAERSKRG